MWDVKNYRDFTLKNGLEVVLYKTDEPIFVGKLIVNSSVSSQRKDEQGVAHFLEHLIDENIDKLIDMIIPESIVSNATTSMDGIDYYFSGPSKYLKRVIETFGEVLKEPTFIDMIPQEREVILREMAHRRGKYNSEQDFFDEVLGISDEEHIGTKEDVLAITENKLKDFFKRTHLPNNMVLILTGGLGEGIESTIEKYFGSLDKGIADTVTRRFLTPINESKYDHIAAPWLLDKVDKEESLADIKIGIPLDIQTERDYLTLAVIEKLVDISNKDSLLHEDLRKKKGVLYNGYSTFSRHNIMHNSYGVLGINLTPHARRWRESLDFVFNMLTYLQDQKLDNKILTRNKSNVVRNLQVSYSRSVNVVYDGIVYLTQLHKIRGYDINNQIKIVESITAEDVQIAARKYLPRSKSNPCLIKVYDPHKTYISIPTREEVLKFGR